MSLHSRNGLCLKAAVHADNMGFVAGASGGALRRPRGPALRVLEFTDSLLVMGLRWGSWLLDTRIIMDRERREILVIDRLFGFRREGHAPFSAVQSLKMATRFGRGYQMVSMTTTFRTTPDARRDLWLDLGEHGKIVLVEAHGRPTDLEDLELMGQRIAEFIGTPFVDTSRW